MGRCLGLLRSGNRQKWSEWSSRSWVQRDGGRGGRTLYRALSRLWILFWVKGRSWEDSKQRIQAEEVMGGLQAEDHKPLAYVLEGSLTAVLRSRMEAKRSLGRLFQERSGRQRQEW